MRLTYRSFAAGVIGLVAVALIAPLLVRGSNCGGNNASLSDVKLYWVIAELAAANSPGGEFNVTKATAEQRVQLAEITNASSSDARFFVSTSPYKSQSSPRKLLIVCDRAFRNVPRRLIGQSPPTHAAAYSDGSTALLSVAEFEALDRSRLIPLDALLGESKR